MKLIISIALYFLLIIAFSSELTAATINPQTYHSENNGFTLFVDPSSRDGVGSAEYTFKKDNRVLWSKTLDQTLVDVKISSAGHIFGYSYSLGLDADYRLVRKGLDNNLSLWMINEAGEVVVKEDHQRGLEAQPPGQHDKPVAYGIVLKESIDTVSFRLSPNQEYGSKLEHWHQFSAFTGKHNPDLLIDFSAQPNFNGAWIEHLLPLPSTDLYLLEMRQRVYEDSAASSRRATGYLSDSLFYLMSSEGEVMWSDVNLGDLRFEYASKAGQQWDRYLDHHALIAYHPSEHQFSIQHLKDKEIIYFEINAELQVTEKNRKPLELFGIIDTKTNADQKPPKYLYSFELVKPSNKPNMPAKISAFAINEKYQIGTLAYDSGNLYFYLINADNSVLKKIIIETKLTDHDITSVVARNDSTFLFLASKYEENPKLFELDTNSELLKEILIDAPGGGRMVVHKNEDITVLASEGGDYLRHFDKQGKVLWTLREDEHDMPGYLSTPADIALAGHGQLIVLDNISNKLNFYSTEGAVIKTIKFSETSHGKLNYPGLLQAVNETIYVQDQDDSTVIHRYSFDGKWLGKHVLKQKNGKKLNFIRDMQADSAGHLWVSDAGLFKFDAGLETFENTEYIGQSQQQKLFNDISVIQTNSKGDIYLFNHENYAVIKLSAKGEQQTVFSVPIEQIPTSSFSTESMFIDDEDQVYINLDRCKYAVFNADGESVNGFHSALKCGEYDRINLTANHNSRSFWRVENDIITLENHSGDEFQVIQTTTKDSNGHWLNRVGDLVMDRKGRLIATGDRSDNFSEQDQVIYAFDENGLPITTIPIEDYVSSIALAGDYIYVNFSKEEQIRVLNLEGQQVAAFYNKNAQQENCKTTLLHADELNNKLYVYGGKTISVYELL